MYYENGTFQKDITDPLKEGWEMVDAMLKKLRPLAAKVRQSAICYRNFKVGAAAIGFTANGEARIFAGANKRVDKTHPKNCAEMQIMRAAKKAKAKLVLIVIIGKRNRDNGSGKIPRTLHPCDKCRAIMRRHIQQKTGVVTRKTKIISVRPACDVMEELTVEQLMQYHGESL